MQNTSNGKNAVNLIFEPGDIGVSVDPEVLNEIKKLDQQASHLKVLK